MTRSKRKCLYNGSMDCNVRPCPLKNEKFYHNVGLWLSCEPYKYSISEDEFIELADMYLCLYDAEDTLREFYRTEKVYTQTCVKLQTCFKRYVKRFLKSGDYSRQDKVE